MVFACALWRWQREVAQGMRADVERKQARAALRAPLPALLGVWQIEGAGQTQDAVDVLGACLGTESLHERFGAFLGVGNGH
jgi:hypothetical protein